MNNKPLFSILIANYNNGKFLQECIDSVLVQTYTHWEIIIVDDCSTDGISFDIYKKYEADNRFKTYFNDENKGCGYTKRRCIEKANGDICAFLDPDDAVTPEALDVMVKAHMDYPNHAIVYSTHYVCDESLNILSISGYPSVLSGQDYFTSKRGHISALASFKIAMYNQTDGLSAKYKRAIDHDLYFKLEEIGSSKFIPQALYYYRYHTGSMSLNDNWWKAKYWDFMIMFDTCKRRNKKGHSPNILYTDLERSFDEYYLNVIRFFFNKKQFRKVLAFYCISLEYSNWKYLLKKSLLLFLIPFKALVPPYKNSK